MSEEESSGDFDPTAPEERNIGRELVDESAGLGSVAAHLYRGEVDRMTMWRQRLDQTTRWAVTLMAAILTWAFSSRTNPHYILLIGMVIVATFLWVEARRYRGYDVWRSRVRMLQRNLFAEAFDPSQGIERSDWRALLSDDYHNPKPKISHFEALSHRLRRVYLPLLGVLLVAWVVRITAFEPGVPWWRTAAVGRIPGTAITAAVAAVYLAAIAVTCWPWGHRGQHVRGEIYGAETDEWPDPDEE